MRRLFDIFLSLFLIIITLPLWIIIILLILIFSPGRPFFVHRRVGRHGREFGLIKFRSMKRSNSDGPCITVAGDKRITSIGKILRRLKLDELPQLLNILKGDMTFVGPRPEAVNFIDKYPPELKKILEYKPGLTDPGTLEFRNEEKILARYPDPQKAYLEHVLPNKLGMSLRYQEQRSFLGDLALIFRTMFSVFQKR